MFVFSWCRGACTSAAPSLAASKPQRPVPLPISSTLSPLTTSGFASRCLHRRSQCLPLQAAVHGLPCLSQDLVRVDNLLWFCKGGCGALQAYSFPTQHTRLYLEVDGRRLCRKKWWQTCRGSGPLPRYEHPAHPLELLPECEWYAAHTSPPASEEKSTSDSVIQISFDMLCR